MSGRRRNSLAEGKAHAPLFAALGDETRLSLVAKLCDGRRRSISRLTEGSNLTRQAITKHLRVLESVGVVRSVRSGRQSLFEFDPEPIKEIKTYLDLVSGAVESSIGQAQNVRRMKRVSVLAAFRERRSQT